MSYCPPEPLESRHELEGFICSSVEQTEWLCRYARHSTPSSATKVFVVTPTSSNEVVAYYAWTMAQIDTDNAPKRLVKGGGRYPQPVALLARLGVHENHEGQGLGTGLLQDVLRRVAGISNEIGCRGLLVHAESDRTRSFYQHLIPEFEPSPTDDLHLVLLLQDIKRTLTLARQGRISWTPTLLIADCGVKKPSTGSHQDARQLRSSIKSLKPAALIMASNLEAAVFRALRLDGDAGVDFARAHGRTQSARRFLDCQQRADRNAPTEDSADRTGARAAPAARAGTGPGFRGSEIRCC